MHRRGAEFEDEPVGCGSCGGTDEFIGDWVSDPVAGSM